MALKIPEKSPLVISSNLTKFSRSVSKLFFNVGHLYKGDWKEIEGVDNFKTDFLQLKSETEFGVELDGEYMLASQVEIEILARSLKVCFPL